MLSDVGGSVSYDKQNNSGVPRLAWRLLAVLGFLLLLAFLILPFFCQASEDAIILYQYSANLAKTGVISFIPHGPRAEGATDFLWMVYLAAGRWLGIPSYGLAIASSGAGVGLLASLLVKFAKRSVSFWNVFGVVALLMLAPQMWAAEAGFSVFAFAFFLGLMACASYFERYGLASITGLLLCLVRPDGVVFAIPLLAVYLFRGDGFRARWWKALWGFVLPGLVYFVWRWHYFGHLLPLPFYVKSDTTRIAHVLVLRSLLSLLPPLVAACAVMGIALRERLWVSRNKVFAITLLVPSSLFYMAMRLDQNYANRFFFYPLVIAAVLLAVNFEGYRERAGKVLLAGLGVWVVCLAYFWINWAVIYTLEYPQPREVAVARALDALPGRGSMIVTESGAIPFYSQWRAYDPWGLNTPAFALHLIQPRDVEELHPDLVIVHQQADPMPCAVAAGETLPHEARSWHNMTQNVIAGVDPAEYTQWLLPQYNDYYRAHPRRWNGQPRYGAVDFQCWFVRDDSAQSAAVTRILQEHGAVSAADYRKLHGIATQKP
jgi:hypothetical protein